MCRIVVNEIFNLLLLGGDRRNVIGGEIYTTFVKRHGYNCARVEASKIVYQGACDVDCMSLCSMEFGQACVNSDEWSVFGCDILKVQRWASPIFRGCTCFDRKGEMRRNFEFFKE